ncbi:hypothetical protein C7212DRAFT_358292 [Tuber magnatum]|uniref:GPI anchored protein n=1 Tax=Tuber magnatum TaxID=42249 RepID=A0A317SWV0_9PEZI|nr:hypothetical protein C7212DRAFT_358292 [Tuber magnatum]
MSRRSISLLSSLLFVLLLFTPAILADGDQQFQDLLRDVPEDRLHAALHDYGGSKFKHVKLAKRQSNTTTASRNTATIPRTTPTTIAATSSSSRSSASPATRVPTTTSSSNEPTTTQPSAATKKKGTTSLTSWSTRTVTGADGTSTYTDVTVVPAPVTDEPTSLPTETPPSTSSDSPDLQRNVGLRVSGGDSVIVAVIAALGFFML